MKKYAVSDEATPFGAVGVETRDSQVLIAVIQGRILLSCLVGCVPLPFGERLRGQGMGSFLILCGWVLVAAVSTGQMARRRSPVS